MISDEMCGLLLLAAPPRERATVDGLIDLAAELSGQPRRVAQRRVQKAIMREYLDRGTGLIQTKGIMALADGLAARGTDPGTAWRLARPWQYQA